MKLPVALIGLCFGCSSSIVYVYEDATVLDVSSDSGSCGTLPDDAGHVSCCNGAICRGLCVDGRCECKGYYFDFEGGCGANQKCCAVYAGPDATGYGCFAECINSIPIDGGTECLGDAAQSPTVLQSCCDGKLCRGSCSEFFDPMPQLECDCEGVRGGCDPDQVCCISGNVPAVGCMAPTNCK